MDASASAGAPAELRLKDLRPGLPNVLLLGRVVRVERRQITRKADGSRRTVLSGLLSDGTATVRFTWWDPPAEGVDQGTVLRVANPMVREYRGHPELSFGWSTRLAPASEKELPDVPADSLPLRALGELAPGDEGFRFEARVRDVTSRTVTVGEEQRVVFSGHLADASGERPFTAWVDFRLAAGEALRVGGAYVRSFRGRSEVTLDERSHVERIAGDRLPAAAPRPTEPVPLGRVEGRGGEEDVPFSGIVVDLVSPSGVVHRCPNCQRVLSKGLCRLHGAVEGTADLRLRLVVDDGTGVATVNVGRALSERLLGRSLSDLVARLREQPDPAALEESLREQLVGRRLRVRGAARVDEFGVAVFPTEVEPVGPDPAAARRALERAVAETGG